MQFFICLDIYIFEQHSAPPIKPCTQSNEAESVYSLHHPNEIWICSNRVWKPFG